MCGICGIMSTTYPTLAEVNTFKALLYVSAFRGVDSTGILQVGRKKSESWAPQNIRLHSFKDIVPSPVLINRASRQKFFDDIFDKRVLLGHCRSATIGDLDVKNAHPFVFENVAGVHNGTIRKNFKHTTAYGTDSEALYRNINDHGIDDALQEVASSTAAYALAYYDRKTHSMNFIRNKERPLAFALTDNKKTLMWASTSEMIEFVAKQMKITSLEPLTKDLTVPFTLRENHLFSFPIIDQKDFSEPVIREIKIKQPVVSYYGNNRGKWDADERCWADEGMYDWPWEEDLEADQKPKTQIIPPHSSYNGLPNIKGYKGRSYLRSYFNKLLDQGCRICGEVTKADEPDIENIVHWWSDEDYVCHECYSNSPGDWIRLMYFDDEEPKTVN